MLGLQTDIPSSFPDHFTKPKAFSIDSDVQGDRHLTLKRILTVVERVVFTLLSVGVSILLPEFSSTMAFLGSFSAFIICVIGPISAKVALAGRIGALDAIFLATASVMATWGTVAAFW
jgi:vesicular inhibitory amino acid transporter